MPSLNEARAGIAAALMDLPGHAVFYRELANMAILHAIKNRDYSGDSDPLRNLKLCAGGGIKPTQGAYVRMSDKWSRFEVLLKRLHATGEGPAVAGESIKDTLRDLAVYSLLEIALLEEEELDAGIPA